MVKTSTLKHLRQRAFSEGLDTKTRKGENAGYTTMDFLLRDDRGGWPADLSVTEPATATSVDKVRSHAAALFPRYQAISSDPSLAPYHNLSC